MGNVVLGYVALLNTLFLTAQQSEFKPKVISFYNPVSFSFALLILFIKAHF